MLMAPAIAKKEDKNPDAGTAKSMVILMVDVVGIKRVWVFVGGLLLLYNVPKSRFE